MGLGFVDGVPAPARAMSEGCARIDSGTAAARALSKSKTNRHAGLRSIGFEPASLSLHLPTHSWRDRMHIPQIPTRDEWKTMRDKQKVPMGAAKVSIGKAIDVFYTSWNAHKLDQNLTDTRQLIANLATYVVAVRQKYPTFVASVEKIKRGAENHKAQLEEVIRAKTQYYPRYEQLSKALLQVKIKAPGAPKPKDVTQLVTNLKGCIDAVAYVDPNWEARRKKAHVLNAQFEKGFQDWTTANGDDSAFQDIVKKVSELRP
jgi:hypothetical protein